MLENVDVVKPGDRVELIGIYRAVPQRERSAFRLLVLYLEHMLMFYHGVKWKEVVMQIDYMLMKKINIFLQKEYNN